MTAYKNILVAFLSGTLCCAPALATNCDNEIYRRYNPDKCTSDFANPGFSFATTATIAAGTATLIGGAIALMGANTSNSSNTNSTQPTLPTYTMVGGDIDSIHLASVMGEHEYTRNQNQYNDIRLAYSLARGYTGKNSTIGVFDSGQYGFHGSNVAYFAGGTIAPDANIVSYKIGNDNNKFDSFHTIGNTIQSATANGTNIYNFSWSASASATQIKSRTHLEQLTDKNFINSVTIAAEKNDAIFVWAAGNDSNSQSSAFSAMPLHIPELNGHFVNVVAWDSTTGALAHFSNACGITKNYCITAPGANLDSPEAILPLDGTSFAAPIVSAAIAVIREAFPYMKSTQITALLFETARDLGTVGVDEVYGHGMLDLERATRPVGTELVPLSDGMTVALRTAHVNGTIANQIKSENIKFAFVDSYGRAFETNLNDKLETKNRSIGFERLRNNNITSMHFGNIELGFKSSELLKSDGLLSTDSQNTMTFIGLNNNIHIGSTKLFSHTVFGTINPTVAPESMVNGFSNILTGAVTFGATHGNWTFTIGIPDTIISGNMYLRTPTGRRDNGEYTFTNHTIDLSAQRPTIEYTASYKSLTAGFVDNAYGTDEFYILAKTKLQF